MGRHSRRGKDNKCQSRTQKRDFREARSSEWKHEKRVKLDDGSWVLTHDFTNEFFEEYYKAQGIVPEEEWEEFLATLGSNLPTTFRINAGTKFAADLLRKLETDLFSHFHDEPIEVDGEMVDPPKALPWYPGKLAWQFSFSRQQLRKVPALGAIHEFVKRENEQGTITRQEAVSMVPPLFLDVHPTHKVLDMCAAPGSKTFQILEMLHTGSSGIPEGLVIANDADAQRCNLLTHQTKRHGSPCLIVTNHEGQFFPHVKLPGNADNTMFDRILCDVPCSGDGTMRKAPDIWKKWSPMNGITLHPLQVRITLQAARLLHVGGLMVYSTCSFNPIENEAVVAEVLRRSKGSLRLVDVSGMLPELRRGPGLPSWKVKDKTAWYSCLEDTKETYGCKVTESMFPADDLKALDIEYCMRFLPHHQDTGGFFVCVLEKVASADHVQGLPTKKERRAEQRAAEDKGEADDASTIAAGGVESAAAEGEEAKSAPPLAAAPVPAAAALDSPANGDSNGCLVAEVGSGSLQAAADQMVDGVSLKIAVADSSVRAMGLGAVAHATSVDSDAEGGVEFASAGAATTSTAQAPPRPARHPMSTVGGVYQHQNQSVGTAPIPLGMEPALSIGQSASADTVQAPGSVSIADDGISAPRVPGFAAATAQSKLRDVSSAKPPALSKFGSSSVPEAKGGETSSALISGGNDETMATSAEAQSCDASAGQDNRLAAKEEDEAKEEAKPVPPAVPQWGARGGGSRNREGGKFKGMDPILPVNDTKLLDSIYSFYGLPPSFPLRTMLITRSNDAGRPKRLYFVSTSVRDLLAADEYERLKIQATGVKVMERQESKEAAVKCSYRITQEGLQCILPFMTKQILRPSIETFLKLLKERSFPLPAAYRAPEADEKEAAAAAAVEAAEGGEKKNKVEGMEVEEGGEAAEVEAAEGGEIKNEAEEVGEGQAEEGGEKGKSPVEGGKPPNGEEPSKVMLDDQDLLDELKVIRLGGCVAVLREADSARLGLTQGGPEGAIAICCYRGMSSINILVSKQEASQLMEKINFAMESARGNTGESAGAAPSGSNA